MQPLPALLQNVLLALSIAPQSTASSLSGIRKQSATLRMILQEAVTDYVQDMLTIAGKSRKILRICTRSIRGSAIPSRTKDAKSPDAEQLSCAVCKSLSFYPGSPLQ